MKGCILPIPKKGDLGVAKNYRGITLTSIAAKIYNALQQNRRESKMTTFLGKTKMASEDILTTRRILEGVRAKKTTGDNTICRLYQGL